MLKFIHFNDERFEKYDNYLRALAIMVVVLAVILTGYLAFLGIKKLGEPNINLQLKGVSARGYSSLFNNVRTPHTLMYLYTSDCAECKKQFDNVIKMRDNQPFPRVTFFMVSLDEDPIKTVKFLDERGIKQEDSFALYYVSPNDFTSFSDTLKVNGLQGYKQLPHTIILDDVGRVLVEYGGLISAPEMSRTIDVFRRRDPSLSNDTNR